MYTKNDLLARLQKREDVDAIAEEMSKALNEAKSALEEIKQKEAEEAKRKEEEKAEAERVYQNKKTAVLAMLDAISDYLAIVGEDELQKEVKDIEIDKVIELLDGGIAMSKRLEKLKDLSFADEAFGLGSPWSDLFFN